MRPNIVVKSDDFLIFTKPEDFANPQARSYAASHAAKFGSRKDFKPVNVRPVKPRKSGCLKWRLRPATQVVVRAKRMNREKTGCQQQPQADVWRTMEEIPMSLRASPSLQNCMH